MNISVPNNYFQIISDLITSNGNIIKSYDSTTFYDKDDTVLIHGIFFAKILSYGSAGFNNVKILNFNPDILYNIMDRGDLKFNSTPKYANSLSLQAPNIGGEYVISSTEESFFNYRDFTISATLNIPVNMLDTNIFKFEGTLSRSIPSLSLNYLSNKKSLCLSYNGATHNVAIPLGVGFTFMIRHLDGCVDIIINGVIKNSFFISYGLIFAGKLCLGSSGGVGFTMYDFNIYPHISDFECGVYTKFFMYKNSLNVLCDRVNFTLYDMFESIAQNFNSSNNISYGNLALRQSDSDKAPLLRLSSDASNVNFNSPTLYFKPATYIYSGVRASGFTRPLHFVIKMQLNDIQTIGASILSFGAMSVCFVDNANNIIVNCGRSDTSSLIPTPLPMNIPFLLEIFMSEVGPLDGYNFNHYRSQIKVNGIVMIEQSFGVENLFDTLVINNNSLMSGSGADMNVYYFAIFNKKLSPTEISAVVGV